MVSAVISSALFNIALGVGLFMFGQHRANLNAERLSFLNFRIIGSILIVVGILLLLAGLFNV